MAGEQLTETIVFIKNYASLCNTLTDINGLLPFFIQESIISFHDLEEVSAITTTQGKVGKLLAHIYGPLTAGDTTGFHKMLTIMKEHGSQATKDLAVKMMNSEMEVSSTKRELKGRIYLLYAGNYIVLLYVVATKWYRLIATSFYKGGTTRDL